MINTNTIYYNVNDWMTKMAALWKTSEVDAVAASSVMCTRSSTLG